MIYANAKKIIIPEGAVKQIVEKSTGTVLWKGGYTNLVDTATTEPGGTEIYGDAGYKNGCRWSSSSNAENTAYAYARLTGWMPYVQGGLLRIKNFGLDRQSKGYGGYVTGFYLVMYKTGGGYQTATGKWYTEDYCEIDLTYTGISHFRISGYCTHNYQGTPLIDPPIVTINEEIA